MGGSWSRWTISRISKLECAFACDAEVDSLVDLLAIGLGDEHLDGCLDVELGCWTVVRWSMFKKFVPWREFK